MIPDRLWNLAGMVRTRDHRALLRVTLWMVGLMVALMTGTLSAYLVLSGLYVGSKAYSRLQARRSDAPGSLPRD